MSTEKGGFFECLAVTRFELHKREPALSRPQSRLDQDRANERTNEQPINQRMNERASEPTVCGVNIQTRSESYDRTTKMHLRCGSRDASRFFLSSLLACARARLSPNSVLILPLFDQTDCLTPRLTKTRFVGVLDRFSKSVWNSNRVEYVVVCTTLLFVPRILSYFCFWKQLSLWLRTLAIDFSNLFKKLNW